MAEVKIWKREQLEAILGKPAYVQEITEGVTDAEHHRTFFHVRHGKPSGDVAVRWDCFKSDSIFFAYKALLRSALDEIRDFDSKRLVEQALENARAIGDKLQCIAISGNRLHIGNDSFILFSTCL
jgi:hypothetical protein